MCWMMDGLTAVVNVTIITCLYYVHWQHCFVNKMLATVSYSDKSCLVTSSQTPKAQMLSECKIPRAWNANIHLQMVPHRYLSPSSYSALRNTTNSQKYLCTFQVFIDATKITDVWSQQHSLFLEWANLEFIVAHVESVPACSKKVGRPESKISCSCKLLANSLTKWVANVRGLSAT